MAARSSVPRLADMVEAIEHGDGRRQRLAERGVGMSGGGRLEMNRRTFLSVLTSTVLFRVVAARAQQGERVRRIGLLINVLENSPTARPGIAALRDELARRGWVEGRNLRLDIRSGAAGNIQRLRQDAAELASTHSEVVLAFGTAAVMALRETAPRVPVVFLSVVDPVRGGFVKSLSHPGGNYTGFTTIEFSLNGKWLELLKEIAPQTRRVSPIGNPDTIPYEEHLRSAQTATAALGIEVVASPVHDKNQLEAAISRIADAPGGGLMVLPDSFTGVHRDLIIRLAARLGLPAVYPYAYFTKSGGLLSYGADQVVQFRESASYIDRILRGAKPSDLPVQQPTKFELVINLQTAKALGLTVPQSLLARADQIIE